MLYWYNSNWLLFNINVDSRRLCHCLFSEILSTLLYSKYGVRIKLSLKLQLCACMIYDKINPFIILSQIEFVHVQKKNTQNCILVI